MAFAMGELKNKYRNSVLGFFWSILEPLILLSVLYVIFSSIFKIDIPYFAIYLLLGLITWNFISKTTTSSLNSISEKRNILSNVYFQRAIPALSSNIAGLIILGLEFIIFSFFLIGLGPNPTLTIILAPFAIFLIFIITLGISLPLSVLGVRYNDIKFIWNIVITVGFFVHPIIYSLEMLPENVRNVVSLLPTVQLLDILHQTIIFNTIPPISNFLYATISSFAILGFGYLIYRFLEKGIGEKL